MNPPRAVNHTRHFTEESKKELLEALCSKMSEAPEEPVERFHAEKNGGKRTQLQDYTSIPLLLTAELWEILQQPDRPAADSLLHVCSHAQRLGLLHPSERTNGVLTCLVMWSRWEKEGASTQHKRQCLQIAKPFIKQYLQHYECVNGDGLHAKLSVLPPTFDALPKHVKEVFGGQKPVAASDACMACAKTMPCRVTNQGLGAAGATVAVLQLQSELRKRIDQEKALEALEAGPPAGAQVIPFSAGCISAAKVADAEEDSQASTASSRSPILPMELVPVVGVTRSADRAAEDPSKVLDGLK